MYLSGNRSQDTGQEESISMLTDSFSGRVLTAFERLDTNNKIKPAPDTPSGQGKTEKRRGEDRCR